MTKPKYRYNWKTGKAEKVFKLPSLKSETTAWIEQSWALMKIRNEMSKCIRYE